ncbi:Peroxidase 12 [Striga hermonthica]|uniref:peroxidase n=1 Tax=Striga hermonthica TaxID=68872 RepID=A0A9N7NI80_STRHE|nr:Peroxidase 12 [Striga hermonthica]
MGSLKHVHQFKREYSAAEAVQEVFDVVEQPVQNALVAAKGAAKATKDAAVAAEDALKYGGETSELAEGVKALAAAVALEEAMLAELAIKAAAPACTVVKLTKYFVKAPQRSIEDGELVLEKIFLEAAMESAELLAEAAKDAEKTAESSNSCSQAATATGKIKKPGLCQRKPAEKPDTFSKEPRVINFPCYAPSQAVGLLRLHFRDCFIQGCDGSVLLEGSASGPGEQQAPSNLSLRAEAFRIIDDLRRRVPEECGRVVSCSDIVALAARDSVFLSGGPDYNLPLGRRDSLAFATTNDTLANLPSLSSNTTTLLDSLSGKNFTATDVVALSGGHTISISHCTSFTDRLYPAEDPTMDQTFAWNLRSTCPAADTDNTTVLDIRGIVTDFAVNQTLLYEMFVSAMVEMSQLGVLTGAEGEIHGNCSVRNMDNVAVLDSVVAGEENEAQ